MRRIVFVPVAILVLLASAIPALAAPPPRIHENGTVTYTQGYIEDCGRTACTFTSVVASIEQGGDTFVCFDRSTRSSYTTGCAIVDPSAVTITDTGATIAPTSVLVEECGRRSCTTSEVVVSAEYEVVGPFEPYAYSNRNKFPDCTETYRVHGERAPAAGTFSVDGSEYATEFGTIGEETYNFSTTCFFG